MSEPGDFLTRSVTLPSLSLLRLDRTGGVAPGNKSFKLREYLALARRRGVTRLVSFGGAWSNHLHALAAVGQQHGFETVGVVRGEAQDGTTPMLEDARRWGMRLIRVSRSEYRRRDDADFRDALIDELAPCVLIPEGGASVEGARGCTPVADMIRRYAPGARRIVLPTGTGTTLAGLVASLDGRYEVIGVSALKGARDLEGRVQALLAELSPGQQARWRVAHDYHCGGFARVSPDLRDFIRQFEDAEGIPLDPVYTGKMLFAVHYWISRGEFGGEPVLAIHTGGLQGRRGFPWLHSAG